MKWYQHNILLLHNKSASLILYDIPLCHYSASIWTYSLLESGSFYIRSNLVPLFLKFFYMNYSSTSFHTGSFLSFPLMSSSFLSPPLSFLYFPSFLFLLLPLLSLCPVSLILLFPLLSPFLVLFPRFVSSFRFLVSFSLLSFSLLSFSFTSYPSFLSSTSLLLLPLISFFLLLSPFLFLLLSSPLLRSVQRRWSVSPGCRSAT